MLLKSWAAEGAVFALLPFLKIAASSQDRNGDIHLPYSPVLPSLCHAPPRPSPVVVLLPKEPLWDAVACFYGNYEHGKNKYMHL